MFMLYFYLSKGLFKEFNETFSTSERQDACNVTVHSYTHLKRPFLPNINNLTNKLPTTNSSLKQCVTVAIDTPA